MKLKICGVFLITCGLLTVSLYSAPAFPNYSLCTECTEGCFMAFWVFWYVEFGDLTSMIKDLSNSIISWVGLFYLLSIILSGVLIILGIFFFTKQTRKLLFHNKILLLIIFIFFYVFFTATLTINLWTIFSGIGPTGFFIVYILIEIVNLVVLISAHLIIKKTLYKQTQENNILRNQTS